jgi:hypothetical protein
MEQRVVVALLSKLAIGHNMDLVNIHYAGQAMSTVDDSLALHDSVQFFRDCFLVVSIQITCCLIKQEDLRLFLQKAASNQNPLAFTARQLRPQIANLRLVPIGHLHDLVMNLALLCHLLDLFLSSIRVSVSQIEFYCVVKEDPVLWNHTDVLSKRVELKVFNWLSIDLDIAFLRIKHPEEQVQKSGLAKA